MERRIERGVDFAWGFGFKTLADWRELEVMQSPRMKARVRGMRFRYTGRVNEEAAPVLARVRQGRWIGLCECGGAERVDPGERTFYCFGCGNEDARGDLRPVVFPHDYPDIEAALSVRPYPINRNWEPGETVGDLLEENREHGLD